MLLNMTRPTEDVRQAWERLGTTPYDPQGNIRDLDEIIDDINDGLSGMTDQERNETLTTLAGSFGLVGINALLAAGGLDTALAQMDEAPSAASLAAQQTQTFSARLDSLKGSIETLMINALTPFMENTLTPLVGKLTDAANAVNDWALANPELTSTLIAAGGALLLVGPGLMVAGTLARGAALAFAGVHAIMSLASISITGVRTAFTLLLGPLGVAIAGAALLYQAYQTNLFGIRDLIDNEVIPAFDRWRDAVNELPLVNQIVNPGASGLVGALVQGQIDQRQAQVDAARGQPPPQLNIGGSNFTSPFIPKPAGGGSPKPAGGGFPKRAGGGSVMGGAAYLVGEVGPELFVPGRSGTIVPNHAMGGQTVNVYLNAYGSNPHELYEMVKRAARERA